MSYFALRYELVDDYFERREQFRAEHLALARTAAERGDLLLAGALTAAEGAIDGALLVWATEGTAAIEKFVADDPYVRNGLVTRWRISAWNVVAGELINRR